MLRASHIQDCVINRNEEIGWSPAKLSGEWWLAQVFDKILPHQLPKLPWRDPHTATTTHDFR
jgi:hypothetical protein